MIQKAIYPGTFDPVTNGHIDLIRRAIDLFPELIVAVASNTTKRPFFSLKERIDLLKQSLDGIPRVSIVGFDGLLINFVKEQDANVIVRGLRAVSDFEFELQLASMNRKLAQNIETLFLTPSENALFISSSLVREIASLKGDIAQFVPACVIQAFKKPMGVKSTRV